MSKDLKSNSHLTGIPFGLVTNSEPRVFSELLTSGSLRTHVKNTNSWALNNKVKLLSRSTLCNPMDCSLPGFSVYAIFQARVLEWVAISFSRGSSRPRDQTQVSCIVGRHFTL